MPPENLPIEDNQSEGDWWIIDKLSQNQTLRGLFNRGFSQATDKPRWWNTNLSGKIILILVIFCLVFAYQNRQQLSQTFPHTVAALSAVNIFPEIFSQWEGDLSSRYSLSSILISVSDDGSSTQTIIDETSAEKPQRIIINKIGVDAKVTNPLSQDLSVLNEALQSGAVRYPGSGTLDEDKNIFIFGHSTSLATNHTYYKTFNDLDELVAGDLIYLQSADNRYIYKVTSVKITDTTAGLVKLDNEKKLILSTCNTLGQKEERILVEADFVKKVSLTRGQTNQISSGGMTPQAGDETNSTYEIDNSAVAFSNPDGWVDLAARIDAVGILDENNNFVASSTPNVHSKVAVKFTVENLGDKKSDNWYFNAVLPTKPYHIFGSQDQQALAPGEKIEFTMGFDKPKAGESQAIVINVDPTGGIKESDKTNNIAKEFITIVE